MPAVAFTTKGSSFVLDCGTNTGAGGKRKRARWLASRARCHSSRSALVSFGGGGTSALADPHATSRIAKVTNQVLMNALHRMKTAPFHRGRLMPFQRGNVKGHSTSGTDRMRVGLFHSWGKA